MDEINFEEEFEKLSAHLSDVPDPEVALSLFDLAQSLESIGEAATYISQFLAINLSTDEDHVDIPQDLVSIIPHFKRTAEIITEEFHALLCKACQDEYDPEED